MYEAFFGFDHSPFNNTPDTRFYFSSDRHDEALAQLRYTVESRKGFAVLTGEVGAGKTTLCRRLLRSLDGETSTAVITNPRLTGTQLLYAIAREYGIEVEEPHRVAILEAINEFLIEALAEDRNVVLVIDEAQNLPLATLEEVRLVSNLETETEKLIQILLLGQPQLQKKLDHPDLLQLKQRAAMRFHLTPLDERESLRYIQHRMRVAGPHHRARFSTRALGVIFRYARGVPRVLNLVCDRTLITAFTEDTHKITGRIVLAAIRDVEGPDWTFRDVEPVEETSSRRPFLRLPFFADRTQ